MKVILHLDLDSYFVSAQRTIQPELKDRPVVISSGEKRSIITAASYEAKKLGIYVPMPFHAAKRLVPSLISIKPNFPLYTVLSTKLFELLSSKVTKKLEVASIDECYMDVTDIWKKYGSPVKIARYIQKLVLNELKLPISIGIASTKFIAKMSTQINKPFGITVTKPGDFYNVFKDWPTTKIHGVGEPTNRILLRDNIKTIGDLTKRSFEDLKDILGARGEVLWLSVNEKSSDEINTEMNDLKGIGNSITFMNSDKNFRNEIAKVIELLCNRISIRLSNRNILGQVVSLVIKEEIDRKWVTRRKQTTLKRPIWNDKKIYEETIDLFDSIWTENPVKFVGVHVTRLTNFFESTYQQSIFDEKHEKSKIEDIVYSINSNLGHKTVTSLKEASLNMHKEQNQSRFLESDRFVKKK